MPRNTLHTNSSSDGPLHHSVSRGDRPAALQLSTQLDARGVNLISVAVSRAACVLSEKIVFSVLSFALR